MGISEVLAITAKRVRIEGWNTKTMAELKALKCPFAKHRKRLRCSGTKFPVIEKYT